MAQILDVFSNPPITRLSSFLTWADSFILEFFFKKLEKVEKKPVGQTISQIGDITKVPASLCYFCHHICNVGGTLCAHKGYNNLGEGFQLLGVW